MYKFNAKVKRLMSLKVMILPVNLILTSSKVRNMHFQTSVVKNDAVSRVK